MTSVERLPASPSECPNSKWVVYPPLIHGRGCYACKAGEECNLGVSGGHCRMFEITQKA